MISWPWDSVIQGFDEDSGFPLYDRSYTAEQIRDVYSAFFSNGVFLNESDAFHVTPNNGMNVVVAGGKCCINGTVGYEVNMRELAIQASDNVYDRIDTIVLRWNANIDTRNIDLYVRQGVAQPVPVRPTLVRNETVYELGIADIFVNAKAGAISAARITDTRLQTERCGAVTPFATIDTTTFFNQIQAMIDERGAELKEQTDKAVQLAKDAISGTVAGNLQDQIDANSDEIKKLGDALDSAFQVRFGTVMVKMDDVQTVYYSKPFPEGWSYLALANVYPDTRLGATMAERSVQVRVARYDSIDVRALSTNSSVTEMTIRYIAVATPPGYQ